MSRVNASLQGCNSVFISCPRNQCPDLGDVGFYRANLVSDVDNACVLRSGLVLITTGCFYHIISNDDELAAVLGHEVAHLIARHILEQNCIHLADWYFTKPFSSLLVLTYFYPEAILFGVPITVSYLVSLALSRVREREADYIGLLLMVDAGFNPAGAVSLWTKSDKWEEERRQRSKKRPRQERQFTSTHPHVSQRRLLCTI